jgi:predicted component of type VI protein secretion system
LVKGALVLGRDPSRCNLLFPAETPGISRLHCSIQAADGGISVTDSGSTHGTFLENGSRIPSHVPTVLHNGQKFYLASANAMFEVRF